MLGFAGPSSTFINNLASQKFGVLHCSASHAIKHRNIDCVVAKRNREIQNVFNSKRNVSFPENYRRV
jgi:hypothetical protein